MLDLNNLVWLKKGTLIVITGCMFAGKTDELIRQLRILKRARKKIVVLKPKIDQRYQGFDKVVTHDGTWHDAQLISNPKQGRAIIAREEPVDTIGFDEINFFGIEFWPFIQELLAEGKSVIVTGLDKDYWNQYDSLMSRLLVRADSVAKMFAICHECGNIATRTQRMKNDKPVNFYKPKILIGDSNSYQPRCNSCYQEFSMPQD